MRLTQFAGDFAKITEMARGLPRSSNVRELADRLVAAAEAEERALRELRDGWQPDVPDLFEAVDLQRSVATTLQKEVEDRIQDLQEQASSSSMAVVQDFDRALSELNSDWDVFHRDYDIFRAIQGELTSVDIGAAVSELVTQFSDLVTQVRTLPTSPITRLVAQILVQAAEEEELALRKLRDAFEPIPILGLGTQPAFENFDTKVVTSNTRRREAAEKLADIARQASSESETAVLEFDDSNQELLTALSIFHQQYDFWRRTEGGCDRLGAAETLSGFTIRLSELATEVRALPRLPILEPQGEVLVAAAEREEQALRSLRDTWRPFDSRVYSFFEQERNAAGKLRRQVAAGLNDLLTHYGVSPEELVR